MHLTIKLIVLRSGLLTFSGVLYPFTPFNSTDVIFCYRFHRFPEGYYAMCQLCHDFKLDFVWSALISCERTCNNTQFCPYFFSTPESTLTHTIPTAVSALLNILQHKALITNWFCFPDDDAALSNGNGFVRCSAGGDVELRERCRNLGQLGMI